MAEHENHGHGGDVRVEESSLSNPGILFFLGLTAAVFFSAAAGLGSGYYKLTDILLREKSLGVDSPELARQRSLEEERLTSYGYVDKDKGIVRIPIDVAMQKVVEDAKK